MDIWKEHVPPCYGEVLVFSVWYKMPYKYCIWTIEHNASKDSSSGFMKVFSL